MAVQGNSVTAVHRIRIYRLGDVNVGPFEFEGTLGHEIADFGKPYSELHKGSIALRDQATLFHLYLALESGEAVKMPDDLKNALYHLFDRPGLKNVTDDACDYDHGERLAKPDPGYTSVRWTVHPDAFQRTNDGWEAVMGENSDVKHILLPKPGYVRLTNDGAYRPDTGTPLATARTREEAEASWTEKGFSPEFARKAVSNFSCRTERSGIGAVVRGTLLAGYCRFYVDAYGAPDGTQTYTGSFRASGGLPGRAGP